MTRLTIFLLLVSMTSYSQTLGELQERKEELQVEIKVLQDSLEFVQKETEVLKKKSQAEKQDEMSVLSETLHLEVLEKTPLLSFPGKLGDTIRMLKKGARAQIIDREKSYFLACIRGDCGYVLTNKLNKRKKEAQDCEG